MPPAMKPALRRTHYAPVTLKRRRFSDADQRKTRRDVLGLSGPVDQWLAVNRAREIGEPDSPLSPGEVRCYIEMHHKEGEVEGDFVDSDTYSLCLTVTTLHATSVPGSYIVFPKIVLETYSGWPTSVHAPDWAQWPSGKTRVFRQTKEELMQFFLSAAPREDSMGMLSKSMESASI